MDREVGRVGRAAKPLTKKRAHRLIDPGVLGMVRSSIWALPIQAGLGSVVHARLRSAPGVAPPAAHPRVTPVSSRTGAASGLSSRGCSPADVLTSGSSHGRMALRMMTV